MPERVIMVRESTFNEMREALRECVDALGNSHPGRDDYWSACYNAEAALAEAEGGADGCGREGKHQWASDFTGAKWALSALSAGKPEQARTADEWHEDYGSVVWWTWQDGKWLGEPSYIGSPLCDDWPGYHTHWAPHPEMPDAPQPVKACDPRECICSPDDDPPVECPLSAAPTAGGGDA